MKFKNCRLILLTGEKHSGKTTFLKRLAVKLKKEKFRIAGFLAPSIYEGAFLLGYDLVDIQNGRHEEFARRKSVEDAFQFSEQGLEFGWKILKSKETRNADLIIIDEFGPLELAGLGWRETIDSLLLSTDCIVMLVVRKEIAGKVKKLYKNISSVKLSAKSNESIDGVVELLRYRKGLQMENEQIYKELRRFVKKNQISCKQCFEAADKCNVSLKKIGRICNEKNIKIRNCQLGCFK
jgi:nucleoside-triphosphatase THEP1